MKKLCQSRSSVHPSPPTISDHLSFLPAYLLSLTASLSPADLEVLAYLISANNIDTTAAAIPPLKRDSRKNTSSVAKPGACNALGRGNCKGGDAGDHDPNFCCDCFRCYMSYWVRWGTSPNRQLIDKIIDASEAGLAEDRHSSNYGMGRKGRRRVRGLEAQTVMVGAEESSAGVEGGNQGSRDMYVRESDRDEGCDGSEGGGDEGEKGSVRRLVSFIGERIWGVWKQN